MKKFIKIVMIMFFTCFKGSYAANNTELYKKIDLFSEVLNKINKEYVDDVNQSKIMDAAINGVLQSLDPYSAYMSPEMYKEMQTETSGEFGGLGIEVSMEAGVVKVITPIDNSPADKVGVKAGDYIIKINESQVQGKTLGEAVELMRGPVGSDIEITVRRIGVKKSLIFKITREIIQVSSVKSQIINKNIGYLTQNDFQTFKNKKSLMAMTGHLLFKKIDSNETVTHSKKMINLIRKKIGFKNILITDDLSMKALKYSLEENVKKSFLAGCNLALHCNGNLKEMLIVAKNSPKIDNFILKKTSQLIDIIS